MGSSLISSFLEIDFEINISDKKSRRFDLKTQNTKPQNTRGLRREDGWGTGFGARMLDEV